MERSEVSLHQVKIFHYLKQHGSWRTNKEIADATGVSLRRTSHHTKTLVALGICDQAEVYPGHRYRLSEQAAHRNAAYVLRLTQAEDIFADQLS